MTSAIQINIIIIITVVVVVVKSGTVVQQLQCAAGFYISSLFTQVSSILSFLTTVQNHAGTVRMPLGVSMCVWWHVMG